MADEAYDSITLDTWAAAIPQEFLIEGPALAKSISDFSAGLKVGKATYDEREHCFWIVLDDWSGGIGYKRLDIREALGTCWDNPDGVEIRHSGRLLLPPLVTTLTPGTLPANYDYGCVGPLSNHNSCITTLQVAGGELYVGIGDRVYYTDATRAALTACWQMPNCNRINTIFEFSEDADPAKRYIYVAGTDGSGTTTLHRATIMHGASDWAAASAKCIEDAIVFNKGRGLQMIIGTTPVAQIVYSDDGVNWSDALAVPEYLYRSGVGSVSFIGIASAPWGSPAVFFLNNGKLYMLDVGTSTAHPIDIGNQVRLVCGCIFQDSVVVTDGWNVWQYIAGSVETLRNIGPRTEDGLAGCIASGRITALISDGDNLYGIWSLKTSNKTQLTVYTGTGWTTVGPELTTWASFAGFVESMPPTYAEVQTRKLWVIGSQAYNSATGAAGKLYSLPYHGKGPVLGTDTFSDGPLSLITGWLDGGFADIEGILLRMRIDGFGLTANETVKVEYRLNNDEAAGWTVLGTFTDSAPVFWFDANHIGVKYYTVQFKITLNRDSATNTLSPDVRALVLAYDKRPGFRAAWTARVDVSRMVNDKIQVGGISGNTGIGANTKVEADADQGNSTKCTIAAGTYTHMAVYGNFNTGTHKISFGVYDDLAGAPNNLVAETAVTDVDARSATWIKLPFIVPWVCAGATFHLCCLAEGGSGVTFTLYYDTGVAGDSHEDNPDTVADGPEDPWAGGAALDKQFSIYVYSTAFTATVTNIWAKLKALYNNVQLLKLVVPTVEPTGVRVRIADLPATFEDFRAEVGGKGYIDLQLLQPIDA